MEAYVFFCQHIIQRERERERVEWVEKVEREGEGVRE